MTHPLIPLRPVSFVMLCALGASLSACTATGDLIANMRSDRPNQVVDGPRRAPMLNNIPPSASLSAPVVPMQSQASAAPLVATSTPMAAPVAIPASEMAQASAPEPALQLEQGMQPVAEPVLAASPSHNKANANVESAPAAAPKEESSPNMFDGFTAFLNRQGISGETDPRLAKALGQQQPAPAATVAAPAAVPAPAPAAQAEPVINLNAAHPEGYVARKPLPGNPILSPETKTPALSADEKSSVKSSKSKSAKAKRKGKQHASKSKRGKQQASKSKKGKQVAAKDKVEVAANDKKGKKEEFPALSTVPPTPPAMDTVKDGKADSQKALEDALTKADGDKKALDAAPFQPVNNAPPAPPLTPSAPPAAPAAPAAPVATAPAATPAVAPAPPAPPVVPAAVTPPPAAPVPPAAPAGVAPPPPPPPVVPSAATGTASSGAAAPAPTPAAPAAPAPAPAAATPPAPPPPPPPPPPGASKDSDASSELAARLNSLAPSAGIAVQPSRTVVRLPELRHTRGVAASAGTDL